MKELQNYPFRVLIVDDDDRDWAGPMRRELKYAAEIAGYQVLIDVAYDGRQAHDLLAKKHYHLVSLDMRLPERTGETLSVDTGLKLGKGFPYVGFPKCLIYSATLGFEFIQQRPRDALAVMAIQSDHYAKSSGSDRDKEDGGVRVLTQEGWANLVMDSIKQDGLRLEGPENATTRDEPPLTVIGAYLEYGAALLPPPLVRHAQKLINSWSTQDSCRIEAALMFIEATARLAFAQTAVLLLKEKQSIALPEDDKLSSCLDCLQEWQPKTMIWNWSDFLSMEAIEAFGMVLRPRNEISFTLKRDNPLQAWASVRLPLQYALDVSAYWVRHPLCINLRNSRDGWSAELLSGTAYQRKRRRLPEDLDFPEKVLNGGVWQSVWRIDGSEPKSKALNWNGWLEANDYSDNVEWMPIYQNAQGDKFWLNLETREQKQRNARELE